MMEVDLTVTSLGNQFLQSVFYLCADMEGNVFEAKREPVGVAFVGSNYEDLYL